MSMVSSRPFPACNILASPVREASIRLNDSSTTEEEVGESKENRSFFAYGDLRDF
jgi:hypothetical protein